MFGTCLWYAVVPIKDLWRPSIQVTIDVLAEKFISFKYNAHITIRTEIFESDLKNVYNYYKSIARPYFKVGELIQSCTVGDKGTRFYSLERKLYLNGSETQVSTYHISVAYRHSEFSKEEVEFARRQTGVFDRIESDDLELQVWSCGVNPHEWKRIEM